MATKQNIVYLVEGETEKKFLQILKTEFQYIRPGKIYVLNVVQEYARHSFFLQFDKSTFVLLFDTDTNNTSILQENIKFISELTNSQRVLCIPQVKNLEDELCYSCQIKNIRILTGSSSTSDFKRDFLRITNIHQKLIQHNFDIRRLWCHTATNIFSSINNDATKIKFTKLRKNQK